MNIGGHSRITTVQIGGSSNIDSFGRLLATNPYTSFDSKQTLDNLPLLWDDVQTSGGGTTSTWSKFTASSTLAVSANTAGTRVRQSKRRVNYQPGKTMTIFMTAVFGTAVSGVTKRLGMFDGNDGIFFEQTSAALSVNVRSNATGTPVDIKVTQANWNGDKLDGTGPSGVTLLPGSTQIFFIDYEWLGVGRVRWGIFYRGNLIIMHEAFHSNESGFSTVYMSTPNLPLRFEISATGTNGAASLVSLCATIIINGGQQQTGIMRLISRGVSGYATGNNQNIHAVLSMRIKSTHIGAAIILEGLHVLSLASQDYYWKIVQNPTIAGADAASWVSLPNSAIEYDVSRTTANTVSGGVELYGGYVSDAAHGDELHLGEEILMGSTIAGVSDQLVVAIQSIPSGAETYFASLTIRELV